MIHCALCHQLAEPSRCVSLGVATLCEHCAHQPVISEGNAHQQLLKRAKAEAIHRPGPPFRSQVSVLGETGFGAELTMAPRGWLGRLWQRVKGGEDLLSAFVIKGEERGRWLQLLEGQGLGALLGPLASRGELSVQLGPERLVFELRSQENLAAQLERVALLSFKIMTRCLGSACK